MVEALLDGRGNAPVQAAGTLFGFLAQRLLRGLAGRRHLRVEGLPQRQFRRAARGNFQRGFQRAGDRAVLQAHFLRAEEPRARRGRILRGQPPDRQVAADGGQRALQRGLLGQQVIGGRRGGERQSQAARFFSLAQQLPVAAAGRRGQRAVQPPGEPLSQRAQPPPGWVAQVAGQQQQVGAVRVQRRKRQAGFILAGQHQRRAQAAQVGPALLSGGQQRHAPRTVRVVQFQVQPQQRLQTGFAAGGVEFDRAGQQAVIGERQRGQSARGGGLHPLGGRGQPFEQRVVRVQVEGNESGAHRLKHITDARFGRAQ